MREKSSTGVLILLATSTVDVVMDWRFLILGELSTKGKMSSLTGFVHCFCYKLARFFFFFTIYVTYLHGRFCGNFVH